MRKVGAQGAKSDEYKSDLARANSWSFAIGGVFLLIGLLLATQMEVSPAMMFAITLGTGLGAGLFVRFATLFVARAAGSALGHALQPSGASTPYQPQYSYQEALVAKGDITGAIASYEALLAEHPEDFEARSRVADIYARSSKQPNKAAEHFRIVQRAADVTPERLIYASNRLVDLYMGPLDDEGKALVELRKIIDRYPGSAVADQARSALASIKARKLNAER